MEASEEATCRYRELATQLDHTRLRIGALGGLSAIMLKRGQTDAARALDEQTLALAEALPDTALILAAQTAQADILPAQGDWPAAHAVVW